MFDFSNLHCEYQGREVLNLPSLSLSSTGHYGLLGENGSGKSTLLNLLANRLRPVLPRGQVGLLPQKPYPFALKVRDSLALGIPAHSLLTPDQIQASLDQALNGFELADLAHKRADRLSGGESQRLALARLLLVPRQVLLLDEPGNHLDRSSLERMEQRLSQYLDQHPCLLVLATHQSSLANRLTDQILILEQGKLVHFGPRADYQENPPC